jgi:hypothetical protein
MKRKERERKKILGITRLANMVITCKVETDSHTQNEKEERKEEKERRESTEVVDEEEEEEEEEGELFFLIGIASLQVLHSVSFTSSALGLTVGVVTVGAGVADEEDELPIAKNWWWRKSSAFR